MTNEPFRYYRFDGIEMALPQIIGFKLLALDNPNNPLISVYYSRSRGIKSFLHPLPDFLQIAAVIPNYIGMTESDIVTIRRHRSTKPF